MPRDRRDSIFFFQKEQLGTEFALGARRGASLPLPLARFGNLCSLWLLTGILLTQYLVRSRSFCAAQVYERRQRVPLIAASRVSRLPFERRVNSADFSCSECCVY